MLESCDFSLADSDLVFVLATPCKQRTWLEHCWGVLPWLLEGNAEHAVLSEPKALCVQIYIYRMWKALLYRRLKVPLKVHLHKGG